MVKIEQTGGRLTEEEILHGKEDAYGIYQINRKGAGRDYAFLSFDSLRSKGKVPERTEYQLVYSDILGADENRDSLFTKFNIAHPDDFTGHSLSVSDIILIKRNGKVNVSYVDMIGFVPLPDFYKEPSLRVVEQITESTKGFTAEGHFGTWHSIQMQEFHNEKFFQMRHDEFGEQVADIIVNEQGQVIAEDLWHGFSPEAMKLIGEYLLSKSLYQKKEVAYLLPDNGYFMIHETDGGYDYTFYNHEFKELDGGVYVAIPKVSSERRRYIPMDYVSSDVISGDKLFMMPNASLYHFGVLNSNVHMAWMRAVGGRLKSDYSYSNTIVYNNFPWPTSTDQQREKIEQTARKILDARELYPDSSLADLYDPLTMPPELLKAHTENNKVVMAAYGFTTKMSEEDCVAELMKLYQKLIKAEKRR